MSESVIIAQHVLLFIRICACDGTYKGVHELARLGVN